MLTHFDTEKPPKFSCTVCDFKCSKQSYWGRHIITAKHVRLTNVNNILSQEEDKAYECQICNKIYKSRVGLWKHLKLCKVSEPDNESTTDNKSTMDNESIADVQLKTLTTLVIDLIKSNQSLQQQVLDVCKNGNTTNTINSHNHSNNKTFNLQFFLNEQCKDAMNIMDFVDTFQLQFDDLERIGEVGYVEGISNLIIDKLNGMDIYKRPIHCSDAKREIMHIKDKGVWEKDNENNDKLRLGLYDAHSSIRLERCQQL